MKLAMLNRPKHTGPWLALTDRYHGRSLASMGLGWPHVNDAFDRAFPSVLRVPQPYAYRSGRSAEEEVDYCIAELRDAISRRATGRPPPSSWSRSRAMAPSWTSRRATTKRYGSRPNPAGHNLPGHLLLRARQHGGGDPADVRAVPRQDAPRVGPAQPSKRHHPDPRRVDRARRGGGYRDQHVVGRDCRQRRIDLQRRLLLHQNRGVETPAFGRWGLLVRRLGDKAPGRVEKVKPHYSSQRCSACGHVDANSRESQPRFVCTACGFADNADVNAAINIAAGHAVTARGGDGVTRPVNREPHLLLQSA